MLRPPRIRSSIKKAPASPFAFVHVGVLCGLLLLVSAGSGTQPRSQTSWSVQWEPQQPVNGSAVLFRATPPAELKQLQATWFERKITLRFGAGCSCWYGVGGVDEETKPGKYTLLLQGTTRDGAAIDFASQVSVGEKQYPSTEITLAPKYVEPPPEVQSRIDAESALKQELFRRVAPESLWSGRFQAPVATAVTAVFGSARVLNKTKKTVHQGLDFHAAIGTPVHAANRGSVLLARNLYFEGNCVMLDHGDGLVTLYMHFSRIKVREGEKVERGQLLGLSGNTGRVNGPHVHFAVRWQGIYLDPETLLALRPPTP
jgi:hypothetical protein